MDTQASTVPTTTPQQPGAPVVITGQGQLPAAPDPRDTAASSRMPHVPTNVTSSSKLSTITAALGYNRFHSNSFAHSTYCPSFLLMSLVLSHIDRIMLNTYRFGQSNPDWHPVMSQMYYGIIFVVHILKVRQSAQHITPDEHQFLEWFESIFPLSSLPVAGPLKHFLQAITVTSGPTKFYGNIVPTTPNQWIMQAANSFIFGHVQHDMTLPPIRVYMDILQDMLASGARAYFDVTDVQHWNRYYRPLTHLHTAPIANEFVYSLPGITDLIYLPASQMPSWYEAASGIVFPPRLAAAAGNLTSIAEYVGFANHGTPHYSWFPTIVSMMQRHAQFFKDSTSLSAVSTVGLGACVPVIQIRANPHISLVNAAANQTIVPFAAVATAAAAGGAPAHPGHAAGFRVSRPMLGFPITATSKSEDLHLLAEQFALLASVNLSYTGLAANGGNYLAHPTDAQLRTGPFWDLPNLKSHGEIDVLAQIRTFLTGTFHVDQRMTK